MYYLLFKNNDLLHQLEEPLAAATEAESSEEDMDLDEEVPDTTIKKKSSKKQKRGLLVRGRINTAAAELTGQPNPEVPPSVQKRKAGVDADSDEPDPR